MMVNEDCQLIKEQWEKFIEEEQLDVEGMDLLNEAIPGILSSIINIGTQGPEVARETLKALIDQDAIPDAHLDKAQTVLRALTELKDEKTWRLLKIVLGLMAWIGDPVGSAVWKAKMGAIKKFVFQQLGAETPKKIEKKSVTYTTRKQPGLPVATGPAPKGTLQEAEIKRFKLLAGIK